MPIEHECLLEAALGAVSCDGPGGPTEPARSASATSHASTHARERARAPKELGLKFHVNAAPHLPIDSDSRVSHLPTQEGGTCFSRCF